MLARFVVLGLGDGVRVVKPEALRAWVRTEVHAMSDNFAKSDA